MAGLDAEPGLGRGDRAERAEDLIERDAAATSVPPEAPARTAASAAAWTDACWRISSDARWNPNVPTCQRSSATSPQAARSRPSATSAPWSLGQLARRVPRRTHSARSAAPARRPAPTGSAQPLGDEAETLAIRFVGEAASQLSIGLRQVLGVASRREASDRATWSPLVAAAIVCISRVATASYPWRTWSAWMRSVLTVISAVTPGLPSRSPPSSCPAAGMPRPAVRASPSARCRRQARAPTAAGRSSAASSAR